jgi:BirA family biotin operon repressor/biotin-[acetyl-CoA-carboxylase] ligase
MSALDAGLLRRALAEGARASIEDLEVFASLPSTNTHLLAKPPPPAGRLHVALADHQTAGRGRRERRWLSSPGSGLCLSVAYTFAEPPERLPGLTLTIGTGIVHALEALGAGGISLKWPNDIVARNGKLGGVLTEARSAGGPATTVVVGIGLNVLLPDNVGAAFDSSWSQRPIALSEIVSSFPPRERIAAEIVNTLMPTLARFGAGGFGGFAAEWRRHDWLLGKAISVDAAEGTVTGIARGVDDDGALLVSVAASEVRIVSGTVTVVEA